VGAPGIGALDILRACSYISAPSRNPVLGRRLPTGPEVAIAKRQRALRLECPVAIEFMCRKIGMTQLFTDSGEAIPVTVFDAGPNRVVQKKTLERDGYTALQIGYGERRPQRTQKPLRGHFEKASVGPQQHLRESRIEPEESESYEVGQEINVDIFSEGQRVDVIGRSKGRGTAGVVKRHNGMKMAGRMGNERVTALNLEVVRVDPEKNLLFIRGGVPGHNDAIVRVRPTVRS
jgi:large subunit ribosomal protein L3